MTNSSVLQIGSTGSIQALAQEFNTGGFTGPAAEIPLKETSQVFPHHVPLAPIGVSS